MSLHVLFQAYRPHLIASNVHKHPFIRDCGFQTAFRLNGRLADVLKRLLSWNTRRSLDEWTEEWRWNRASTAVQLEWRPGQLLSQQLMVHTHTHTHTHVQTRPGKHNLTTHTCTEADTKNSHSCTQHTHLTLSGWSQETFYGCWKQSEGLN